jgi:hypothetical protein
MKKTEGKSKNLPLALEMTARIRYQFQILLMAFEGRCQLI